MELSYDPKHNIAYLKLKTKQEPVETIRVSDQLNIDLSPDGSIYGIELLNANEQLKQNNQGKLILINEAIGQRQEISF